MPQVQYLADPGRSDPHVPESRFGIWFLGTEIWAEHVLERWFGIRPAVVREETLVNLVAIRP